MAPRAHLALPTAAPPAAQAELWPLVLRCQRALEELYAPEGFNLGMNLGQGAGAGVSDHFHFHVVPRWVGDTSFMTVVGGVRLIPEEPAAIWQKLRSALAAGEGA